MSFVVPAPRPAQPTALARLIGRMLLISAGATASFSCSWGGQPQTAPDLAFVDDIASRYEADASTSDTETSTADAPSDAESDILSIGPNPATICRSTEWVDATSAVFLALGDLSSATPTVPTGRGCRSVASAPSGEIEVRLEVIDPDSVEQVATFRAELADGEAVPLMGFTELEFVESADRVSSSLLHPELDRLEEHRWIVIDDLAIYLFLAVEPGGSDDRPAVLETLATLETDLQGALADYGTPTPSPTTSDPVVAALTDVLQSVLDDRPLGNDQATDQGRQSIALEYNFVSNLEGIAAHQDQVECTTDTTQADCTIVALDVVYRFGFVADDSRWLLDDFRIET